MKLGIEVAVKSDEVVDAEYLQAAIRNNLQLSISICQNLIQTL